MKTLTRLERREDGIVSRFWDDGGEVIAITLEHSFDGEPKIPNGTYTCVRGTHRIPWRSIVNDPFIAEIGAKIVTIDGEQLIEFETFEITGIDGHKNILFHWGNYNEDSDGCVLTGQAYALISGGTRAMVTNARATFAKFMAAMKGVDSFPLSVVG